MKPARAGARRAGAARSDAARDDVEARKAQHLRLAAEGHVSTPRGAGWDDIHLIHQGLPVADLGAIELRTEFLGHELRAPLVIAAMTGGHRDAAKVNARLARAAEHFGVAMGLGSQRAALHNPRLVETYAIAREEAPHAFLIGNVGAAQLVPQDSGPALTAAQLSKAAAMIRADALAIHLNFLEETIQPEGDRRTAGLHEAIAGVIASLRVPAIAKETGAGISRETALALRELGFRAIDVGGVGGTSFAAIEMARAAAQGDRQRARLGQVYQDWGIPTAVSIVAAGGAGLPLIATGGVRSGLDAAKAIALGASLVGVGRPLLVAALRSDAAVEDWMTQFLEELRVAVFLSGGRSVQDLRRASKVVLGDTRAWIEQIGIPGSRSLALEPRG